MKSGLGSGSGNGTSSTEALGEKRLVCFWKLWGHSQRPWDVGTTGLASEPAPPGSYHSHPMPLGHTSYWLWNSIKKQTNNNLNQINSDFKLYITSLWPPLKCSLYLLAFTKGITILALRPWAIWCLKAGLYYLFQLPFSLFWNMVSFHLELIYSRPWAHLPIWSLAYQSGTSLTWFLAWGLGDEWSDLQRNP